jgi:hypothetical protein
MRAAAFLGEPRGNRFAAHLGARARFVQRRDLIFQRGFQRAQPREGAVQTGIEGIEFAAHRAAKPAALPAAVSSAVKRCSAAPAALRRCGPSGWRGQAPRRWR